MNDRRSSAQRGAVDQRVLIGAGALLALGAAFALARRGPSPSRAPAQITRRAQTPATPPTPTPAADVPAAAPRVEDDFHVVDPGMPSYTEEPRQRPRPAADVPPIVPASTGDYGMDVANIIRPALPAMQRCLSAINPGPPRAADVWVTISTRGRVSAARLDADAGASVDACLLAALQPLAFASPGTEAMTFGIPVPAPSR